MDFSSFKLVFIIPVLIIAYNIIGNKWKELFLLSLSFLFYFILQPKLFLICLTIITTTYFFTKYIAREKEEKKRSLLLKTSIIVTLLPLFFYKYFNNLSSFIIDQLQLLGIEIQPLTYNLIIPIGLSFYTFMAIGYLVDVYNEEVDFEPNYITTALFLSFFPYILSGPIERAGNMFSQFKNLKNSTWSDLVGGAKLLLWGAFMKLCVANRLAIYVDLIFSHYQDYTGSTLALTSILYPIQVYADLGGYTLLVLGFSKCLGITIIPNFKRPFFATSVSEFWRRWHMSLIQWLTDYIFTPLSFSLRKWKLWGIAIALILTFLISGLWHGATICFAFWGIMQGIMLSIEAFTHKRRNHLEQKHHLKKKWWYVIPCIIIVYLFFAFTEIWDKSAIEWNESTEILHKIFFEWGQPTIQYDMLTYFTITTFVLFLSELRDEFFPKHFLIFENKHTSIRFMGYIFIILLIINLGAINNSQFIYFNF